MEAFATTAVLGNIYTNAQADLRLQVSAYNSSQSVQPVQGRLLLKDFYDAIVAETNLAGSLPAHGGANFVVNALNAGRRGFFRAQWTSGAATQEVRCAVIEPAPSELRDSPLGFNHAYPWDYLMGLARQAGVVWWRDWSAKWHVVEPQKGRFDFADPDVQIQRVLDQGGQPLILLPFPSSAWATSYQPGSDKDAGRADYPARRKPMAYAPKDLNDFGHYAAAVVNRYKDRVRAFHVLNEPIYTDYALPRNYGYGLDDYLRLTEIAHRAIKAADPTCTVVGGIAPAQAPT